MAAKRIIKRGTDKILKKGSTVKIGGASKDSVRNGYSPNLHKIKKDADHFDRFTARFKDDNMRFTANGGWGGMGKAAAKGAVIGGGVEGSIEYMSGGSFWEGAKGGAMKGAMVGGGFRAVKQRTGAQTYFGQKGILNTMEGQRDAYGAGVRSLLRNQKNVKKTEDWMKTKGKDALR